MQNTDSQSSTHTPASELEKSTDHTPLSKEVRAQEASLLAIKKQVGVFKGVSDAYLFGKFGLDAMLGFIPVVGSTYTLGGGLWLFLKARQAQCSAFTQIYTIILIIMDAIIGFFFGIGDIADIFFRSHAWASDRIHDEICDKLEDINKERQRLRLSLVENNRQSEFKGMFENQRWLRWLGITLVIAICAYFIMTYYSPITLT